MKKTAVCIIKDDPNIEALINTLNSLAKESTEKATPHVEALQKLEAEVDEKANNTWEVIEQSLIAKGVLDKDFRTSGAGLHQDDGVIYVCTSEPVVEAKSDEVPEHIQAFMKDVEELAKKHGIEGMEMGASRIGIRSDITPAAKDLQ